MTPLAKTLDNLSQLHPKVIDLSLGRLLALLQKMDNPQNHLPPVIHIAGTNGKGSTQAFLKAILIAHGKTAHAYTSPHLVRFNERIELAGQPISDGELMALAEEITAINEGHAITFFEVTTAMAFLAFSRHKADYLILEVGLGGRFDATNVIEAPLATAITSISVDHEEFLGSDIVKIAQEKAGIFKEAASSFWAKQQSDVHKALQKEAALKHVPYQYEGQDWSIEGSSWLYKNKRLSLAHLGLKGKHQQQNAALALTIAAYILGDGFDEKKAAQGLSQAFWPGRLQKIEQGKLKNIISCHNLYLDGAHNRHGAEILVEYVKNHWQNKPLYLLWGMLNNRDAADWLLPFKGLFDQVITLPLISTPNGHSPQNLKEIATAQGFEGAAFEDMVSAFQYISALPKGNVLMAGSLYMLGAFLEGNEACIHKADCGI